MVTRRWVGSLLLVAAVAAALYVGSAPSKPAYRLPADHAVDLANGETLFWAGGCASCHAAPGSEGDERLHLAGGLVLPTPFGEFRVPNISSDPAFGIGGWTNQQFVRAMRDGVSPQGEHYYPAFPYNYYQHMTLADMLDLRGFLGTLPAVAAPVAASEIDFPYNLRRGVGFWKRLYLDRQALAGHADDVLQRGEYLVRGPGHCGFCHTPRNFLGGPIAHRFLAGAPALELPADGGPAGWVANITSHADGLARWHEDDIAFALETGFDLDYDSFGGDMVAVQKNMAKLTNADRAAMAAYLKSVPALPSAEQ